MNNEIDEMIVVTERRDSISIKLPYEIKDNFRKAFRSATWNSGLSEWQLKPTSRKRLSAWVDEVKASGALESLRDRSELDMTEEEVERLRRKLSNMRNELARTQEQHDRMSMLRTEKEEIVAALDQIRPKVDAAAKKSRQEAAAAAELNDQIIARTGEVIDIDEMNRLVRTMLREARDAATARGRVRFDEAQAELAEIFWKLDPAGLYSAQLHTLVDANYNRKAKDLPDWQKPVEFTVNTAG